MKPGPSPVPSMRRLSRAEAGCLIVCTLLGGAQGVGLPVVAAEAAVEKRVEHRDGPAETAPRPAGVTPGSAPAGGAPATPEKCPPSSPGTSEPVLVVEQVQVTEVQTTVVVEVPVVMAPAVVEIPGYWTVDEVLLNARGRSRVTSVAACTDPRYPLPSYGLVGIEPAVERKAPGATIRLQRFEVEIEADAAWQPSDSVFTLVVGLQQFQVSVSATDRPEHRLIRAADGSGGYPISATVLRGISSVAGLQRSVLSLDFPEAAAGRAPRLDPGEGVYLSADPSETAPPGQGVPKFLLVKALPDAVPNLVLIEKSGSNMGILPAVGDVELAASCSVVHFLPR